MDEKSTRLLFKGGDLIKDKEGEVTGVTFELSARNYLLFNLQMLTLNSNVPEDDLPEITEAYLFLSVSLGEVELTLNKKINGFDIKYTYNGGVDVKDRIDQYFRSFKYIRDILTLLALKHKEAEAKKKKTPRKYNKGKFKRSGHLTDQMLKYTYPKDKSPQLSLWDRLGDLTKKDIETNKGVDAKEIVEGIKLSTSEQKVIDCLCRLLHETSQTLDPKGEDYYSGNIGYELVKYGDDDSTPAPKLSFTLYELTKEYKGGEAVSGKDVENVKNILQELDKRRFLLSYVETYKKKDGGRIERKIEGFKKLIEILKISQTEYSKEDTELSKTEETIILLNPIFRRQINSKFITYPNDINRRTIIAYGSHSVSESTFRLRDYLARELSNKHYEPEIYLDRLYYLLNEKWMGEGRKKKVKEYTEKGLETCKALGLLLSYEIKEGATGEPKIVFKLNKKWQ